VKNRAAEDGNGKKNKAQVNVKKDWKEKNR
jgi:hypothetical protein